MFVMKLKFDKQIDYGIAQQLHGYIYEQLGFILEHKHNKIDFIQFVEFNKNTVLWHIIPESKYKLFFNVFVRELGEIKLKKYTATVLERKEVNMDVFGNKHIIHFVSPFFFKNSKTKKYESFMDTELLINKLSDNRNKNSQVEYGDFKNNISIKHIKLKPVKISFFKVKTLGLVGSVEIEYEGENFELYNESLLNLMMSGYGIKNSLGFGGVKIENIV